MSFTMIQISHTFLNLDGSSASGSVVFRLSDRITNSGSSYDSALSVTSTLNGSGELSIVLPANNDPTTVPANTYYNVAFMLNGAESGGVGDSQMIMLPYNAEGGTIDLGLLLPQTSGDGV